MQIHHTYSSTDWSRPLLAEEVSFFSFDDNAMWGHFTNKEGLELTVPYSIESTDSICFATAYEDYQLGHDQYQTFALYIDVEDQQQILERNTWLTCHISLDGRGQFADYSGTARIRGRGNSTWLWYDKKPYKIKLDRKSPLLGLAEAKDWNLLANYRDVTDIMNTFAFEAARQLSMPHTNHTRYVELFLNGEYQGLYQLTEKIEVDENRIDINPDGGVLLCLDLDDGPSLSPSATDNFWSSIYSLPICVKYPDEPTTSQLQDIRRDFAVLEAAIRDRDFSACDSLMDIASFISILQLHEYLYNVEIEAPRSLYIYRDPSGPYTFGPVWDWDAGYDFDWSDMYTGHTFFTDYTELIFGTDPYRRIGAAYHPSSFFTTLFGNASFVARYKESWLAAKDSLYTACWAECRRYTANLNNGPYRRDAAVWPISGKSASGELHKMSLWLQRRLDYLTSVIANYPSGY